MEDIKQHIDDLIVRYLDGNLDKCSAVELEQWVHASAANRKHFGAMREVWFSTVSGESVYDKEMAYALFRRRVKAQGGRKSTSKMKYWRYAAIAVSIALVAVMSFLGGKEQMRRSFSDIVVEAPIGSRTKVKLPDGSLVWLNAGSKIIYSQGFGMKNRYVSLLGEGYFEVVRNEKLPFDVVSNSLYVRVLGTSFNFRDYPADREVVVSLADGKVALRNLLKIQDNKEMKPNDYMVMDKAEGLMNVKSAAEVIENSSRWTEGCISFDEKLLSDIVNTLELNYNVKIEVKTPSLLNDRYRGIFFKQEQTIGDILAVLSTASMGRIRYDIEDEIVVIY